MVSLNVPHNPLVVSLSCTPNPFVVSLIVPHNPLVVSLICTYNPFVVSLPNHVNGRIPPPPFESLRANGGRSHCAISLSRDQDAIKVGLSGAVKKPQDGSLVIVTVSPSQLLGNQPML